MAIKNLLHTLNQNNSVHAIEVFENKYNTQNLMISEDNIKLTNIVKLKEIFEKLKDRIKEDK